MAKVLQRLADARVWVGDWVRQLCGAVWKCGTHVEGGTRTAKGTIKLINKRHKMCGHSSNEGIGGKLLTVPTCKTAATSCRKAVREKHRPWQP